ncbi:MAG: hypothetical protein K5905_25140, partial [Roseibium sp.]|nr:hypothetical protein [Roseibium sp.]
MPLIMNSCRRSGFLALLAVSFAFGGGEAHSQEPRGKPVAEVVVPPKDSELYCRNIADAASNARIQWQTWKLISLEARLRDRIAELQRKEKEFEKWVIRREELLN